jgi:hypothetical protein
MTGDLARRRAHQLRPFDAAAIGGTGAARCEGACLEHLSGSRRLASKGRQSQWARP